MDQFVAMCGNMGGSTSMLCVQLHPRSASLDLFVLAGLPKLTKLQMWNANGNSNLSQLPYLQELAILACDVSCGWQVSIEVNELLGKSKLEQLHVSIEAVVCNVVLPEAAQDSPLHTLLLASQWGLPEGIQGYFGRLKVLALLHAGEQVEPYNHLTAMTRLEALSLAGTCTGGDDEDDDDDDRLCIRHLVPVSKLR